MGFWNTHLIFVWDGRNRKTNQNEIHVQILLQKMRVFGKAHLHRNLQ